MTDYSATNAGLRDRLLNDHTYHVPFGDQGERYDAIRKAAYAYSITLLQFCPPSRELSLALTHLEEVVFYANAAIARTEKENA